eukprot:g1764.t1
MVPKTAFSFSVGRDFRTNVSMGDSKRLADKSNQDWDQESRRREKEAQAEADKLKAVGGFRNTEEDDVDNWSDDEEDPHQARYKAKNLAAKELAMTHDTEAQKKKKLEKLGLTTVDISSAFLSSVLILRPEALKVTAAGSRFSAVMIDFSRLSVPFNGSLRHARVSIVQLDEDGFKFFTAAELNFINDSFN